MQLNPFRLLVGGELRSSSTGSFGVVNPSNEEVFAEAPDASAADLDQAVSAAEAAFQSWSNTPVDERRALIRRMAEVLAAHHDELVEILVREQGKSVANATQEVTFVSYFANETANIDLEPRVLRDDERMRVEQHYRPMGVVGAIAPWNYPLLLGYWKVFAALATGNTVVLKPSPYTPLATLRAAELFADVVPAGVLNVLSGGDALGAAMTAHPGIQKISFTGSCPTGRKILASAAADLKRVTLELGGNDAAIVLPDAQPDEIAEKIFWAAFNNSGQICMAIKRLYVHRDLHDDVCDALVAIAKQVKVGDGFASDTILGPVQNAMQFDKVCGLIDDVRRTDARVLTGGEITQRPGYFVPVTLVADARDGQRVVDEEAFGPVLPIIRFDDPEEALHLANSTSFGLGGSVWTEDVERGRALAQQLRCGTAWVNQHSVVLPDIPFGGLKNSGLGVEGAVDGLHSFCDSQILNLAKS